MERKILSIQDWGLGGCLQTEEALRNQGISPGRRARILQCHQSQGKLRGMSGKIRCSELLGGRGGAGSLGTKKGSLDLATGK